MQFGVQMCVTFECGSMLPWPREVVLHLTAVSLTDEHLQCAYTSCVMGPLVDPFDPA